jgi:MarR family transcriptional regulator, negative regulator of the multidrug operon emrRAB
MHIAKGGDRERDVNVLAAWALAVADAIRGATEMSTGMSGAAPAALVAVVADPGMTIEGLRRVLGLTHPGTIRLVDRLVEVGWVDRRPGTGRAVHVVPTAEGVRAERRLAAARRAAVAGLHDTLSQDALHTVAGLLDRTLAAATGSVEDAKHLCRLCDRPSCASCPVAGALAPSDDGPRNGGPS